MSAQTPLTGTTWMPRLAFGQRGEDRASVSVRPAWLQDGSSTARPFVEDLSTDAAAYDRRQAEELDVIRREAYEEALRRAEQDIASQTARLQQAAEALQTARSEILAAAETELVDLSLAITESVLTHLPEAAARYTRMAVAQAMGLLRGADAVQVRVAPRDAATLVDHASSLSPSDVHVKVIADSTVEPGGAILATSHALVDASLKRRVRQAAAQMLPNTQVLEDENTDIVGNPTNDDRASETARQQSHQFVHDGKRHAS